MSSEELRNHKMRHVLIGPVRHVTCYTRQERNVKGLCVGYRVSMHQVCS